jgi:hypothetical protein
MFKASLLGRVSHLLLLAALGFYALEQRAGASLAQMYIDEATEFMERAHAHTKRLAESKGKNMREFAARCAFGLKAVQALDGAIDSMETDSVDDVGTKAHLIATRFELVSSIYGMCGAYWPRKYGGKCDYDYNNKECEARRYEAFKW